MGSPKNITESLTRWQGQAGPPPPSPAPAPTPSPMMPERRLRTDVLGGVIYTLIIGALLCQVVFLLAFDLL